MQKELFLKLKDPRLYVVAWLTLQNIRITARGEFMQGKETRSQASIFDTLWLDYIAQVAAVNDSMTKAEDGAQVKAVRESNMVKALNELVSKERAHYRRVLLHKISCKTQDLKPLGDWLTAVMGDGISELDLFVMAHWIWLVKRKLASLPVENHIMPVLFGAQSAGKSIAISKLLSPISDYRLNMQLPSLADYRYYQAMEENFVIVFGEMQGHARADIESQKHQITADYNDARTLGTAQVLKVKQNCSFIGDTNKPLVDLIRDTTGMRRFWQVNTQRKMDWDLLNKLDYKALWAGVNEHKPQGYLTAAVLPAVRRIQEAFTVKDSVAHFLEEYSFRPGGKEIWTVKELFQKYVDYCRDSLYTPSPRHVFGRKLSELGFEVVQKWHLGKNQKVYYVEAPRD